MDVGKSLSKNLIFIRRARGLSQEEFSRELHIARSTLQQIEQGHTPTLTTLAHIAGRLDCPISLLLDEHSDPSRPMHAMVAHLSWFAALSPEDQSQFLTLAEQLLILLRKEAK